MPICAGTLFVSSSSSFLALQKHLFNVPIKYPVFIRGIAMDAFLPANVFCRILAVSSPHYLRDGSVASQPCEANLTTACSASLCVPLLCLLSCNSEECSPLLAGDYLSEQADPINTNLPLGRNYLRPTFTSERFLTFSCHCVIGNDHIFKVQGEVQGEKWTQQ